MCDLSTILTVFQAVSAHNQAESVARKQDARYLENAANARKAQHQENRDSNRRIGQEEDAAEQKKFVSMIENLQGEASATVAGGEANISGTSLNALLRDINRVNAVNQNTIDRNFDMRYREGEAQKESSKITFGNRVNSVSKGNHPSVGKTLGGIALTGASALDSKHQQNLKSYDTATAAAPRGTKRGIKRPTYTSTARGMWDSNPASSWLN